MRKNNGCEKYPFYSTLTIQLVPDLSLLIGVLARLLFFRKMAAGMCKTILYYISTSKKILDRMPGRL